MVLFSLLFFISLVASCQCTVDPNSDTIAITQDTSTICGITTGSHNRSIQCVQFKDKSMLNSSVSISPALSFDSISGGQHFICSLRSGDASFFCWEGINKRIKRVYNGPMLLKKISVGARHVAAIDGDGMLVLWWRYGCNRHSRSCLKFPRAVYGEFHSLTSGDRFSCAISTSNTVTCWGPHALLIQKSFSGTKMRSLTAGRGRMCGLNISGYVKCTGKQSVVPSGEAFEFTSLAVGRTHTCAIRRTNGTAVCLDRYGSYFPMRSTQFVNLVAEGDLTCGLTRPDLNVACWNGRNRLAVILPMPKILPGPCLPNETFCSCGVYPGSWNLCGGSGVVCLKSDNCPIIETIEPSPQVNGWFYVLFIVMLVLATLLIGILVIGPPEWFNSTKIPDQSIPTDLTLPVMDNIRVFSFNELVIATNNFSRACWLGCGGTAIVYHGRLTDGRLVAVKRYYPKAPSFQSELKTLHSIRHENVITLIGYCTENFEVLVVTTLARYKDLHYHISPYIDRRQTQLFCCWKFRIKVLLGAARGIEYMHPEIVHRGITSTNILVDENWVAKITGLRLAVIQSEPECDNVDVAVATVGMAGYRDMEYSVNDHQNDVYSFGVVMLEVLTGKVAYDAANAKKLADIMEEITADRPLQVLDRRLDLPEGRQMEADYKQGQWKQLLSLDLPAI